MPLAGLTHGTVHVCSVRAGLRTRISSKAVRSMTSELGWPHGNIHFSSKTRTEKTQQIPLAHTRLVLLLAAIGLEVACSLCLVFWVLARSLSSAVKRHCQLYFSNLSVLLTTLSEAQRESSGKPKDALVTRRPSLSAPCTGAHGAPQTHGGSCSLWFDEYISRARANHSMIDVAAHTCLC